jgi:predicted PurR-regulated permease PerM
MTFGRSLGLVLLVFCLLILWQIRQILLLSLMAILLAQILNLAVTWWQRHHLKRSHALIITLFGFFIGIIGIFVGIIPALVQQFRQLFSLLPQAIERLWGQVHSLEDYLDPSPGHCLPGL